MSRLLPLAAALLLLGACAPTGSRPLAPPTPRSPEDACFDLSVLPETDRAYADSLLAHGLDHEALFTLAAPIKPISSLAQLRLPLARPDTVPEGVRDQLPPGREAHLVAAERFHRVARALRCGSLETVVVPYRRTFDGDRILQMTVVDRDRLDAVLARDAVFWGAWGLVPGADPHLVVTMVETAAPLDRHRGYGYLFGYPEYAVTFFTESAREQQRTGELVERDFFQVPVHRRPRGHFTYAIPRGHTPTEVDSSIHRAAAAVLAAYRARREAYLRPDSSLRAADLLRDWRRDRALSNSYISPD